MLILSKKTKDNIKKVYESKGFAVLFDDQNQKVLFKGKGEYSFDYEVFNFK